MRLFAVQMHEVMISIDDCKFDQLAWLAVIIRSYYFSHSSIKYIYTCMHVRGEFALMVQRRVVSWPTMDEQVLLQNWSLSILINMIVQESSQNLFFEKLLPPLRVVLTRFFRSVNVN